MEKRYRNKIIIIIIITTIILCLGLHFDFILTVSGHHDMTVFMLTLTTLTLYIDNCSICVCLHCHYMTTIITT